MSRNKLYVILSTACVSGYFWLIINYHRGVLNSFEPRVCLFKRITNIPCPSCGTTRSVLSILNGDFSGAIQWNPFGFIIVAILILSPVWILIDVISHNNTLFRAYNHMEYLIKRKWVAVPLVLLVILNWIWNIYKEI